MTETLIQVNRYTSITNIPHWLSDFVTEGYTYHPNLVEKWSVKECNGKFYLMDFGARSKIVIEVETPSHNEFIIKLINKVPMGNFLIGEAKERKLKMFANNLSMFINNV